MDLSAIDRILELHKNMQHLKSPLGTKDSPTRSCHDLYLQNSDIANGEISLHCVVQFGIIVLNEHLFV